RRPAARAGNLLGYRTRPVRRRFGRRRGRLTPSGRNLRGRQPAGQARRELHAARTRRHDRRPEARSDRRDAMIAELGLAALWLAAALAGLQLVAGLLGLREGGAGLAALVRPAAAVQALLCALAFGALLLLFIRTDLSVALVAKNSHSAKPFIFKL